MPPEIAKVRPAEPIRRRHRHRPKKNANRPSLRGLERFFLRYGLGYAGAVLVALGLIYLVANSIGFDLIRQLVNNFLLPSPERPVPLAAGLGGAPSFAAPLVLQYLPGFIPLIAMLFLPKEKVLVRNVLVLIGFAWLLFFQAKFFTYTGYHGGVFFENWSSAFFTFLGIEVLVILIAVIGRHHFALTLAVLFFAVSIGMLRSYYGRLVPYFLVLGILQGIVLAISVKYRWRTPFIALLVFAGLYLAFYILRKIILSADPFMVYYMIPSLGAWLALSLTGLGILRPASNRKRVVKWWRALSYICITLAGVLGFFAARAAGMSPLYIWVTLGVEVVLVGVVILNERYNFLRSHRTLYYAVCIGAAALAAQLIPSQFPYVLPSALAVGLLINVLITRSRTSFVLSLVFFFLGLVAWGLQWVFATGPALVEQRVNGAQLPLHLVLTGLLVASMVYFYARLARFILFDPFYRQRANRLIPVVVYAIVPIALYMAGLLLADLLILGLAPAQRPGFAEVAAYSFTFLWIYHALVPVERRGLLRMRLVVSLTAIALWPVLVQPAVAAARNAMIGGDTLAILPFALHGLALVGVALLLMQTNGYIATLWHHNKPGRHWRRLLVWLVAGYFLLVEYNHFSALMGAASTVAERLKANRLLPWSLLLMGLAFAMLVHSVVRGRDVYKRDVFKRLYVQRRIALVMIVLLLVKIFVLDLRTLSGNGVVVLLIILGLVLIGLAWVVPRLRKKSATNGRGL